MKDLVPDCLEARNRLIDDGVRQPEKENYSHGHRERVGFEDMETLIEGSA